MAWTIKIDSGALKTLKSLDKQARQRIERFLDGLANEENPRSKGLALQGEKFAGLWRYRVGDYRLICQIRDGDVVVLVLQIGYRKEVYR
jgi:mRNA interferase RelE/StbE